MKKIVQLLMLSVIISSCAPQEKLPYEKQELLFEDSGTKNWQDKWMLDGLRSEVINSEDGMELIAGPEFKVDADHTVLWTKQDFEGDLLIEYDYTRTDNEYRCVNILYFLATGKGDAEYPTDISLWNEKREVPAMRTYFNNMNTYHISYAAFANNDTLPKEDYIRLRRYIPNNTGLNGTDIEGDDFNTGLFKENVTYKIKVWKLGTAISMTITNKENPAEFKEYHWDASTAPECTEGRIGLRHMYTRSARYKDFKVWSISK